MSDEGEEIENLLPSLENLFNSIGLTLKKTDDSFKSTYEIMQDLAGVWDTLSDFKQAQIIEAVAGKRQANVLSSLLTNFEDAQKSLELATNSTGSAMIENERYLDSIDAKVNQFKNTVIGFWQVALNSEGLKIYIDLGSDVINLLTKIIDLMGLFPSVASVVTLAVFALHNNVRLLTVDSGAKLLTFLKILPAELRATGVGLQSVSNSAILAGISLKTLTFSFATFASITKGVAAFLAGSILPVAGIMAFTYAISKAGTAINKFHQEQKDLEKQTKNLRTSWGNNRKEIQDLVSEYEALSKKSVNSALSNEEQDRMVQVQNELNQLLPTLTDEIDAQGNAHLKNIDLVNEEIEAVKELQKAYNAVEIGNIQDNIEDNIKKINEAKESLTEIKTQILTQQRNDDFSKLIGDLGENEKSQRLLELELKRAEAQRQVADLYSSNAKEVEDSIRLKVDEAGALENVTEATWDYVKSLINEQKESLGTVEGSLDLTDTLASDLIALADAKNQLDQLNKSYPTYGEAVERVANSLRQKVKDQDLANSLLADYTTTVSKATDGSFDLATAQSDLINQYKSTSEEVEVYNKLLSDMAEGKQLSVAEAMELIVKEEALANAISFENGMVKVNIEAVKNMRDAKIQSYKDIGNAALRELEVEKNKTFAVIQGYLLQTQAIKSYAEARRGLAKVEANDKALQLTGAMGAAAEAQVNDLYGSLDSLEKAESTIKSLMSAGVTGLKSTGGSSKSSGSSKSATKDAEKYERQLEANFNLLQKIASTERQITDLQNKRELLSDNEKIRNNINAEIELTEQLYTRYNDLAAIQGNQREKLASQFNSVSKGVVTVSKDMNVLSVNSKLYNKLTDKQKEKIDNLISSYDDLTNAYNDNLQKKLELKAGIQDLNNELDELIQKTKEAYQEWKDEVNDVADEIIDVYKDFYEKKKDIELSSIDEEIDAENNRHDRKMDNLDEELDQYEEIINARLKLIDLESEEEDYNKNLTDLQKDSQEIQNKINVLSLDNSIEAKAQREELAKQLAEKEESIEELKTDRTRELRKKNLQNLLDDYKKEIKAKQDAENKKHDATKEHLEAEKKEIENYYNDIINNERKFAKIRENVLDGNLKNIKNDFADFANYIKENSELIGNSLSNNLIDKISDAGDALGNIDFSEGKKKKKAAEDAEKIEKENDEYAKYKQPLKSILYWKQQWERANNSSNAKYKTQIKAQAEEAVQQYYNKLPSDLKSKIKGMNASGLQSYINTLHSGGVVGKASGLSKLFNEFFNTKPNEQIVKMLEKEIAVPEVNLSKYAIPNLQNLVSRNSGQGNVIHVDKILDIQNFTNNTNTDLDKLIDRATDRFVQRMNGSGYVATVR